MEYKLSDSELTVKVDSFGAELKSIRNNQNSKEYMWSGNKKYWGKTSPVLFPFVGAQKDGVYRYNGKEYPMTRHGFARDMEFQVKEQEKSYIIFVLHSTGETLEKYPFQFCFEIEYRIESKTLKVIWRVFNKDNKTMCFSVGGHPAFACPLSGAGKRTDCFLLFDTEDEITISEIDMRTGLLTDGKSSLKLNNGFLPITESLFDKDALVIENSQCHSVALCGRNKIPYLKVDFDAPLFGVWSVPEGNASYVCIEPWYGRCDRERFEGELEDKEWLNILEAGERFEKEYTITVL